MSVLEQFGFLLLFSVLLLLILREVLRLPERRISRRLAPLGKRLGLGHSGDDKGSGVSTIIEGTWQGDQVSIEYERGSLIGRHDPAFTRLRFAVHPDRRLPVRGQVMVRRQNLLDLIAARIGLTRRLWRRHYRGGGELYVEAEDDHHAAAIVKDPAFRESVLAVLGRGYSRPVLALNPERVELVLKGPLLPVAERLQAPHVERVLRGLQTLARIELPEPRAAKQADAPDSNRKLPRALGLVTFAVLFGGSGAFIWAFNYPTFGYELELIGLALGSGLALVFGVALLPVLRGRSRALRELGLFVGIAFVGFVLLAVGGLLIANARLDVGVGAHEHLEGRISRVENGIVTLETMAGNAEHTALIWFWRIEGSARRGRPVQLTVRPGYFEAQWVSRVRVVAE